MAGVVAGLIGLYVVILVFVLIIALINLVINCMVINKAEPGHWWKGIIPYYNMWTLYDISMNRKTTILIFVISVVGVLVTTCSNFVTRFSEGFNQGYQGYNSGYSSGYGSNSGMAAASLGVSAVALVVSLISLVVSLVVMVAKGYASFALARAFGKETVFCVLTIFFPLIMKAIIVFGSSEYEGEKLALLND